MVRPGTKSYIAHRYLTEICQYKRTGYDDVAEYSRQFKMCCFRILPEHCTMKSLITLFLEGLPDAISNKLKQAAVDKNANNFIGWFVLQWYLPSSEGLIATFEATKCADRFKDHALEDLLAEVEDDEKHGCETRDPCADIEKFKRVKALIT